MARDHRPGSPAEMQRHSPGLSSIDALLPTPKASDCKSTDSEVERARHTPSLPAISVYYNTSLEDGQEDGADLMPTPQARDWKGPPGRNYKNRNLARDMERLAHGHASVALVEEPEVETVTNTNGDEQYVLFFPTAGNDGDSAPVNLLPTPVVTDAKSAARGTTTTGVMHAGTSLTDAIRSLPPEAHLPAVGEILLPTPKTHVRGDCPSERDRRSPDLPAVTAHFPGGRWGKYGTAVARWEELTRPAPSPTEPNRNGNPRLTARFSEWLLGWPAGWVTDPEMGISRTGQLRLIGNGVVPQQAAAALTMLLNLMKDEDSLLDD